jgi:hypothetical protein
MLRNDGYKVVVYDAWANDNTDDAYSSFATSLIEELEPQSDLSAFKESAKRIGATTSRILSTVGFGLASKWLIGERAAQALEDFEFSEQELSEIAEQLGNAAFDSVLEARRVEQTFRRELERIVEEDQNGKIIIIIDELDRCRPEFAMELLERIKHLFSVPGCVFFLMVDEHQLSSMINVRYGSGDRSNRYLNKFIDWKYKLRTPTQAEYLDSLFLDFFNDFDASHEDGLRYLQKGYRNALDVIKVLSEIFEPTARELNQYATRVFMALAERPKANIFGTFLSEYLESFSPAFYLELKKFYLGKMYNREEMVQVFQELALLDETNKHEVGRRYSYAAKDLFLSICKPFDHRKNTIGEIPLSIDEIAHGSVDIRDWVEGAQERDIFSKFSETPYSLKFNIIK